MLSQQRISASFKVDGATVTRDEIEAPSSVAVGDWKDQITLLTAYPSIWIPAIL